MNSLLDDDELPETKDREISLGTTMLLGIFFALALLCALFFGFGYSLGRKSVQGASGPGEVASGKTFNTFKPAPGKSTIEPDISSDKSPAGSAVTVPYTAPPHTATKAPIERVTPPETAEAATPAARPPAAAATTPSPAVPTANPSMVQIAAVSHQEDADLLVSTLKRRGYSVAIHTEPQDRLLHVQVGPFPTRKDAEAMRQKLLSDGFNAIVK